MGYTQDTHINQWVPASMTTKVGGTWTTGVTSNVVQDVRSSADAAFDIFVPVVLPSSGAYRQGARLESINVYYKIGTGAADDFATLTLMKMNLPANGISVSGSAVTTTLDAAHDTAAERKAVGSHCMTVTLSTPCWIDDSDAYYLHMNIDAAANTVFTLYGARVNYDLNI